ncbi:distal membrane-arm assembly complex protein 2 isoform X1 [Pelodiscus sinensis]|uniref:distal membrane-arm assembly complex protein 2 isoform X1 n=1 Tax=Pelodiscus sinensis TaxID=13735 RepID=UPI003F6A6619
MAAPRALQPCRGLPLLLGARRLSGRAAASEPLRQRFLRYLCSRFYDIESLVDWSAKLHFKNLRRKNAYCGYTRNLYGDNIAAAYFALSLHGGVRFQGQERWFRAERHGTFNSDFLQFRDVPVEAIDLAGSVVNYHGLDNLVKLTALKSLDLSRCPNVDEWALSRLHVFAETLEELSLAGCPQVTERGLACLQQLENLRRLDLSHLPAVPCQGLLRILVEEMLPGCEVVGLDSGAQTSQAEEVPA